MNSSSNRRCLLFVVDAISHRIVRSHIENNDFPNIGRLLDQGGKLHRSLSIFPSITPAATCSIVTGCYPSQHHIEGATWFERERGEIAYFGDDLQFAMEKGIHNYFVDFADHLNFQLLRCPTIFEQLHELGIDSACINYMWFAGPHQHKRRTPLLARVFAGKLDNHVSGPKYLKLGEFVEALPENVEGISGNTIFDRYGFKDECTKEVLLKMAAADALPSFTLAYFPNNDDEGHAHGPTRSAQQVLLPFDEFLGQFVERIGGWEVVGNEFELIIAGDHSQTEFGDSGPNEIRMDECLSQFKQAIPGNGWQSGDQIFACPNMRAAAIYQRDVNDTDLTRKIVRRLLAEPYVDQVIYEDLKGNRVVETADRGSLIFSQSNDLSGKAAQDAYKNHWVFTGDLQAVDCRLDADGRLIEGDYPNVFERIDGAFVTGSRPIWITARPDAEFRISETSTHSGGSHGALNFDDTEAALITSRGISFHNLPNPEQPRIIDIASLCKQVLTGSEASTKMSSASN